MPGSTPDRLLSRLQFLAWGMTLVLLAGWLAWFWPYDDLLDRQGTPLGADFAMFYIAGEMAAEGDFARLYQPAEHQRRLQALFPALAPDFCLPFRYPPAVAICLAPLSRLPYPVAWVLFTLGSCAALACALWHLRRTSWFAGPPPDWHRGAMIAAIGWPVTLEVLIGGQGSLFALAIAASALRLLATGWLAAAGGVLALSAYKPNVLLFVAVGIAIRYPRVLLGAVPVSLAVLGLNRLAGTECLQEFVGLSVHLSTANWQLETPFWKAHHVAPWLDILRSGMGRTVSLVAGTAAAAAIAFWWRRANAAAAAPLALAGLFVVNSLFNPYTPIYDLVLLLLAVWLVAECLSRSQLAGSRGAVWAQIALGIVFLGPHLSQALARPLGGQLFPLVLLAVAAGLFWRMGADQGRSRAAAGFQWKELGGHPVV